MAEIKVNFHSPYNFIAGKFEVIVEVDSEGISKSTLREILLTKFPSLLQWCGSGRGGELKDFLVLVVDTKLTPEDELIKPGSIVDVLYPLSGG